MLICPDESRVGRGVHAACGRAKPSWCFTVGTVSRMPSGRASRAHARGLPARSRRSARWRATPPPGRPSSGAAQRVRRPAATTGRGWLEWLQWTKSPKRAPCRTRSSLDRVGDLQRRRHGRLAGLDRRRRRARFAERHRFHARLDGNWTAGRRGGDDALQPHAEPARDALGLRARIGPGLLERAAQQLVLLRERELEAADAVRAGRDGGIDHRADLVDRRIAHAHIVAGDVPRDPRLARFTRPARLVARLDRVAHGRHRAPRAEQRLYRSPDRGAPPRALRRGLARFRCRRLDGERELGTIRRRPHLALPAHDERASLPSSVLRKRETRYGDKEPARDLRHSRPVPSAPRIVKPTPWSVPCPRLHYTGTGPPR